ncbi:unnamed protein product [Fraxinus pennsylvanica]|uniref:Protein EARLY FLOWERING 4 domain-containing protein n=1 Tax=Fraxinus pennsylvanica TaxID=56036 RepID=A0AAD2E9Q4_9LAMI|nr:unnamed protein product [Fraxinus pennsylvanica]
MNEERISQPPPTRRQSAASTQNPPQCVREREYVYAQISTDFWACVIPISTSEFSIFYRVSWVLNFKLHKSVEGNMGDNLFSGIGNEAQIESKVVLTFQKNFVQVQKILDQNTLLINEINQNHGSKILDNLTRNVGLIRELNNNFTRVVGLYADLSNSFTKSMEEGSSEADSTKTRRRVGQKRIRSNN